MKNYDFFININKNRILSIVFKNITTDNIINLCRIPNIVYLELLNLKNKNPSINPILSFKHIKNIKLIPSKNNELKVYDSKNKKNHININNYIMNIYFSINQRIKILFNDNDKYASISYEQADKKHMDIIEIKITDKCITKEEFCSNSILHTIFDLKLDKLYIIKSKNTYTIR